MAGHGTPINERRIPKYESEIITVEEFTAFRERVMRIRKIFGLGTRSGYGKMLLISEGVDGHLAAVSRVLRCKEYNTTFLDRIEKWIEENFRIDESEL